ncbi:hypothetical protein ACFPPD_21625 [Cohnella suwonensis]|uniref:STAS/SEC14 domain-containing protein n=1 Tax=Cohnella suwonensis TaxID=696072 RepID=A0ABW0M2Y8_9BACL
MVHFDTPYATVTWKEDIQAVFVEWKGFAQGEDYRMPYEKGLELLVQKKARKWLLDSRMTSVIHADDQVWIAQDFNPRNHAAGMRYIAAVTPEKVIGRTSARKAVAAARDTVEFVFENFESMEEAERWLSEVD